MSVGVDRSAAHVRCLPLPPQIETLLTASQIDGKMGTTWLTDDSVAAVRKACLLNILAVLCVTPARTAALILDVIEIFAVLEDRIYAVASSRMESTLDALTQDTRQPFYEDPSHPLVVHRRIMQWPQAAGFETATQRSFRAEGAPSLQIVIAESPYRQTVADLDLDEHNPDQDLVGLLEHFRELHHGVTDHFAIGKTLRRGPAAQYLAYTLGE